MQPRRVALIVVLVLTAGCLQSGQPADRTPSGTTAVPTTEPPDKPTDGAGPATTADGGSTGPRTTALTPDWMTPETVVEVQSAANRTYEVTVRLVELDTNETGRTITRRLEPGEEFEVERAETNAPHWRAVVTVDGSVVFEETIYHSEQYWVTIRSRTNASYASAVA